MGADQTISPHISLRENFLRRVGDRNVPRAALWLFLYASPVTALLAAAFVALTFHYAPGVHATVGGSAAQKNLDWFGALVFNPLVESLLLAGIVRLGVALGAGTLSLVIAASAMAAMHSLANPTWGLTVVSYFLVQSYAFVHTYRNGFWRAFLVLSIAHAMHNACVIGVVSFR